MTQPLETGRGKIMRKILSSVFMLVIIIAFVYIARANAIAAANTPFSLIAPPAPPVCTTPTTNSFNNTITTTIPVNQVTITSTITVSGLNNYLWDVDVIT